MPAPANRRQAVGSAGAGSAFSAAQWCGARHRRQSDDNGERGYRRQSGAHQVRRPQHRIAPASRRYRRSARGGRPI